MIKLLFLFLFPWMVASQPFQIFDLPLIQAQKSANGAVVAGSSTYNPASDTSVKEWLKADALSLANNDPVSSWTASTGNAATQGTGANQPTFNTNIKNSLPAISFPTSDSHWLATTTFGTLSQPYSVWIVFQCNNASSNYRPLFDGLSGSNRALFAGDNSNTKWTAYAGNDLVGPTIDASWHIVELVFNGSSSSITFDNGTPTTGNAGSASFVGITIGRYYNASNWYRGYIGEIIVQDNTRTATRSAIFAYLNAKWTVY